MPFHLLVAILPAVAACTTGSLTLYAWQRREVNGARSFAGFMGSVFIWCFFNVFEQLSPNAIAQTTFGKIEYFGIAPLPVFWLLFTLRYAQRDGWLNRLRLCGLSAIPFLSLWLALSNHWHGWIWRSVEFQTEPFPQTITVHGWWFNYAMVPYCYALMLVGFGVLMTTSFSSSRLYRKQTLLLLCASVAPFACNVLYVVAGIELYGLDVTPIGFTVAGILVHFGLFRARFLDIAPVSYRTVFLNTADAVVLLDIHYRIVDLNSSAIAQSIWYDDVANAIGQPFESVCPDYQSLMNRLSAERIELTETIQLSASATPQSQDIFRQVKVRSLNSPSGKGVGWVIIIRDVTLEKQQQALLHQMAFVDSLTGLSNRRQLEIEAPKMLSCSDAESALSSAALLYIDLNHFKPINDTYGHDVGDAVLQYFSDCLRRSVRQGDMVVRLGGDEFAALLYEADSQVALDVRSRLNEILNRDAMLMGHRFSLSASVGVSYYPTDGHTLEALLRQADKSMYREKSRLKAARKPSS